MPLRRFAQIVDQFPRGRCGFVLCGLGMPMLNPDFPRILEYVRIGRNDPLAFFDSFNLVDERMAERLLEIGPDQINLSFDAATAGVYESLRPGSSFDAVVANIRRFVRLKHKKGLSRPRFLFNYMVTTENVGEMEAFIPLAAEMLDGEPAPLVFSRLLYSYPEVAGLFQEIPEGRVAGLTELAARFGLPVVIRRQREAGRCSACRNWLFPFIGMTGHVFPCGFVMEGRHRAFIVENALGNVFERHFQDIWEGPRYQAFRERLQRDELPEICRFCPAWG